MDKHFIELATRDDLLRCIEQLEMLLKAEKKRADVYHAQLYQARQDRDYMVHEVLQQQDCRNCHHSALPTTEEPCYSCRFGGGARSRKQHLMGEEAMRHIVVKGCEDCPLYNDGDCYHPDRAVQFNDLDNRIPWDCPLRTETLVVMATEEERR